LPADLVALGHDLGSVAHHHIHARHLLEQPGMRIVHSRRQSDAFHAAADRRVGASTHDLIRSQCDRLQTGRAIAVDGGSACRGRQTGQQGGDSRDVVSLRAKGLPAAHDDVFDFARIELRCLAQHILDAVRRQFIGTRQVERSAE
jgi:hypothetical protein